MSSNLIFRKDINILRAFAVIFVVLYHFEIPYINNGFVGVDIFFVISGYLMTAIIFNGFGNNSFSLKKFLLSRYLRIVPALLLLAIILFTVSYFDFMYIVYKRLVNEIVYAIEFLSNIEYEKTVGYFDISANKKWLLHTWSLSVEFQFYLIYPILLLFLKKFFGIEKLKYFVLFLFICSLVSSIYYSYFEPSSVYYLLQFRAWELLAGALIFLFPLKNSVKIIWSKELQYVTILLLILFLFLPNFEKNWGGFITIVPIALTALYLYSNNNETYLINNKVLMYIGLWSYSIYLWHWVIRVFLEYNQLFDNAINVFIGLLATIIFAMISYYTVERKFKYKGYITTILLIVMIISLNIIKKYEFGNFTERIVIKPSSSKENLVINKVVDTTKYILIGDSHAHSMAPAFNKLAKNQNISFIYKTFEECKENCENKRFQIEYEMNNIKNKKDKTLFIVRKWESYDIYSDVFPNILDKLASDFKNVYIMLQVPRQMKGSEDIYMSSLVNNRVDYNKLYLNSISFSDYLDMLDKFNKRLYELSNKYENVTILDPTNYFCDEQRCLVGESSKAYYYDDNHLNSIGADKLLPLIEQYIKYE